MADPSSSPISSARTWIKAPLAILAEGAANGLVVEGCEITELVPLGAEPSRSCERVFDASAHVVLPGLINTHHHFFQTMTRAHPAAINKELFPWLQALYPVWARLTPESFRVASRLALVELLMSGCTTAADHHYFFAGPLGGAIDIEVEEARALGIRLTATRGSMNLSRKDGGLPPDDVVQDEEAILLDSERVLSLFHDPAPGSMIQIGLAPCSPFSVTPRLMRRTADLAQRYNCRLHTHLAETRDEDDFAKAVYGCRPVDILDETGWLNPRVWLAHGVHFDDRDIERLGRHGVGVCHCPTSNAVLASGICRTRDLEAANVAVGLGVDGSASNDSSNMMEAVRHALMVGRLRYGADAVTHRDVLRWATEGSARCLGRTDIGRLAPGMQADLALFKLDELRFSGTQDPLAALVLCGAHRADRVMVGGRWRVEDGVPIGVDLPDLLELHRRAARGFAQEA